MSRFARRTVVALAMLASLLPAAALAQVTTRNFELKASRNDYPPTAGGVVNYSACWSYIHSDGREYAIIGVNGVAAAPAGTAIYNVHDPSNPYLVGFIDGPLSHWREMKSYRDWIYVVSEGGGGIQIIRMTDPEHPVLAATYSTNFFRSHTVSVDTTRGLLVCNGTIGTLGAAGLRVLALNSAGGTPEAPVEIGWWPGGAIPVSNANYVHDSVPIGDRLYASSINVGTQRVLDFTDPTAVSQISAWTYPGGFSHNAWPDATGDWLYVTDEIQGQPLKIFDISNVTAPLLVNGITSNPRAIVHNSHVLGNELYLSSYTEGIRALDLTDPAHPAEFGWADSYAGVSGGFSGVWAVCPYFPSGTVIASDRNTGLYVYRPVRDYGLLRVEVVNGGSEPAGHACGVLPGSCCCAPNPCTCGEAAGPGEPMPQHEVFVTSLGDSLITPTDGVVQFAPGPGVHALLARHFGFYDAVATPTITTGVTTTVTLPVVQRPTVAFSGVVRSAATTAPLEGAEVSLAYTPLHQHTDPSGTYALNVPDDTYLLQVRRGGYVPLVFERRIGPGFPGLDYSLVPAALWHDLEANPGWTVGAAGDNAITGVWTRVAPIGTGPRPPASGPPMMAGASRTALAAARVPDASRSVVMGEAPARPRRGSLPFDVQHEEEASAFPNCAPYMDHTPGAGTMCFVTGQGDSLNVDGADVDGGKTTLTTTAFNTTGMTTPTLGYWRWFLSYWAGGITQGSNAEDPADYLAVLISNDNGANWTPVDSVRGARNHWEEHTLRIADYVTPSAQVKLRFVCADVGPLSIVEAGIDDLTLFDGATPAVAVTPPAARGRLAFRAPSPNPSAGAVQLVVDLPEAGDVTVDVLDVGGRRVRTVYRGPAGAGPLAVAWDGRDGVGRASPAGLYFARARLASREVHARLVRVR